MKKTTTLSIVLLLFVSTINAQIWGSKKVKGNGNVTTETRNIGSFDGVKCAGSLDFVLVAGTEGEITLEGESNLLKYIITEVKGDNIVIKTEKGVNLYPSRNKGIRITIPFEDISKVSLAGSGDLKSKDIIDSNSLSVSLAGSGDIKLNLKANSVKAAVAGSGDLTLKGNTNTLEVKVAGSGDFHGFDLQANNTVVSVAGSGDAQVVSHESIKGRVAGSGDIVYAGNPEKKDNKVAGSGSINAD